ncbi:VanZ like protein [Motilibacter peucedani]|uniref:VanZ like protein n=1 Tax=Motilibacter peucedani TaxID=598650 RepID=A0A420XR01_9ACTN|nr:VanZ family protein [Motilibacter peucedani]RKS75723.1 VanZ like protein [Motilibacter peucedani]
MATPWHELSPWPFVVPLGVLAFAAALWWLQRRAALTVSRAVTAAVACVYGGGVVANTVFPIFIGKPGSGVPWWDQLNLTPLQGTDVKDMLQNVVVFLPFGVLLPLLARVRSVLLVLVGGFLSSLGIELVQLVQSTTGNGGHVADVNDLLANTVGAPGGYAVYRAALLLPRLRRLAEDATWPPTRMALEPRPLR